WRRRPPSGRIQCCCFRSSISRRCRDFRRAVAGRDSERSRRCRDLSRRFRCSSRQWCASAVLQAQSRLFYVWVPMPVRTATKDTHVAEPRLRVYWPISRRFREEIANEEPRGSGGYRAFNESGALGAYQPTPIALEDIKWRDKNGVRRAGAPAV